MSERRKISIKISNFQEFEFSNQPNIILLKKKYCTYNIPTVPIANLILLILKTIIIF